MKKTLDANLGMHILEVEITSRCNLNCRHCYNRDNKISDLPLKKITELYEFANKNKIWTFIISGGEAILHPQFNELVNYIKTHKHSFRLVLQSNGLLVNDNVIKWFKAFDLIHLSFDLVEDMRCGGYKNLDLAKKLKAKGINAYLFSTIYKTNFHLIDKMVAKANQAKIDIGFNCCLPLEKIASKYIMSKPEFIKVERKLYELYKAGKTLRYSSPLVSMLDHDKISKTYQGIKGGCTAGVAACVISPSGEVYPCPFFRLSAGSVFKKDLKDIWLQAKIFKSLRQREKFAKPCGDCEFLTYCGGCRNRAYLKYKNLLAPDPMCYKK